MFSTNFFYDLPDDLINYVYKHVHKEYLKGIHLEIKYGWPLCRKLVYKNKVYTYFLNSEMSNASVKTFYEYMDFKNGKTKHLSTDNVYFSLDIFLSLLH